MGWDRGHPGSFRLVHVYHYKTTMLTCWRSVRVLRRTTAPLLKTEQKKKQTNKRPQVHSIAIWYHPTWLVGQSNRPEQYALDMQLVRCNQSSETTTVKPPIGNLPMAEHTADTEQFPWSQYATLTYRSFQLRNNFLLGTKNLVRTRFLLYTMSHVQKKKRSGKWL